MVCVVARMTISCYCPKTPIYIYRNMKQEKHVIFLIVQAQHYNPDGQNPEEKYGRTKIWRVKKSVWFQNKEEPKSGHSVLVLIFHCLEFGSSVSFHPDYGQTPIIPLNHNKFHTCHLHLIKLYICIEHTELQYNPIDFRSIWIRIAKINAMYLARAINYRSLHTAQYPIKRILFNS